MLEHLALIHLSMAFIENLSNLWNIRTHNIYILGYICPTISLSETTKPSRSDSSGDLEPLLEYRITPQDFDVINLLVILLTDARNRSGTKRVTERMEGVLFYFIMISIIYSLS